MIDLKEFIGFMNLDDENDVLPPFHHKYLMNGRFRGSAGKGLRVESVPGTVLIPNYLLPAGTNECIGAFFDQVKQRILWANFNSNGRNGWYQYNLKTKTVSKIFLCFTDSATDIFRFSRNFPIHSCAIVYRSDSDGDLFYWTDGNVSDENRPRYLNLDTVAANAPFTEDMINAAKNAPLRSFDPSYQDDAGVTANNLNGKLFQFSYAWGFKSGEQSTIAPWSKVALPVGGYTPDTQNDVTKNNTILVTTIGGPNDYKKIYLYGRESEGKTWSDPFLIDVLDRDDYSINPNTVYFYYFRNDGVRTSVDLKYTSLPFDYLPDYATTLESLNGNVIIYGNTTDGYDAMARDEVDVTVTTSNTSPNIPSLTWAYSGANVVTMLVGPVITTGATYHVEFNYVSGTVGDSSPKNINYVTLAGATQDTVGAAIAAALTGSNISATYLGSGTIRVITTPAGLPGASITNFLTSLSLAGGVASQGSWLWASQYRVGLIYFDDRGKTNGVISYLGASVDTTDFAVTTPLFSTSSNVVQVPVIEATINHLPPTWAVRYQWVRTRNLTTTKFIQYVTSDYQDPGDGYLYFCIQNLYFQNAQNTGFVPTYDFAKGDRIKVMAAYNVSTNFYTAYNVQLDFEIVGIAERTMASPASAGKFIKVVKPATLPSTAYSANMFIQVYTPAPKTPKEFEVFYEWGEEYEIYLYSAGVYYHAGQVTNQTPTQPASFRWFDGDVYIKQRTWYLNAGFGGGSESAYMMDANYSDYFSSAVNSNGRGWGSQEGAKTITNGVQLRWGQKYLQDTDVNDLNRFYPEDIDTVDLSGGSIQRICAMGRELDVFQNRKIGRIGVYTKNIQDNAGTNLLATTNEIITPNNIYYHPGEYGLGNQPTALVKGINCFYIDDPVRGIQLRLADDGITEISTLYKGQYTIKNYLTPYNKDYLRTNGSKSKILKVYDYFENQAHSILQEGSLSSMPTIPNRNFSFNEPRNTYTSFYGWHPEWAISAQDIMFSWKNGALYSHTDETDWSKFYSVQDYPSITMVFNKDVVLKKVFNAISYNSNKIWVSDTNGDIMTSMINPQTGMRQVSQLKAVDFEVNEGVAYAALLRDANSGLNENLALLEGDFLTGNWIEIKLTQKSSAFSYLYSPYLSYIASPRNF